MCSQPLVRCRGDPARVVCSTFNRHVTQRRHAVPLAAGSDFICVQSYDGQLSVYHNETMVFSRFLPNFLVPGPLAYCVQSDSILTCNSAFELESYKFSVLAAAAAEKSLREWVWAPVLGVGPRLFHGAVSAAGLLQTSPTPTTPTILNAQFVFEIREDCNLKSHPKMFD